MHKHRVRKTRRELHTLYGNQILEVCRCGMVRSSHLSPDGPLYTDWTPMEAPQPKTKPGLIHVTREQMLSELEAREWIETDDWKHYTCLTCHARHRMTTPFANYRHTADCLYKAMIEQIKRMPSE